MNLCFPSSSNRRITKVFDSIDELLETPVYRITLLFLDRANNKLIFEKKISPSAEYASIHITGIYEDLLARMIHHYLRHIRSRNTFKMPSFGAA